MPGNEPASTQLTPPPAGASSALAGVRSRFALSFPNSGELAPGISINFPQADFDGPSRTACEAETTQSKEMTRIHPATGMTARPVVAPWSWPWRKSRPGSRSRRRVSGARPMREVDARPSGKTANFQCLRPDPKRGMRSACVRRSPEGGKRSRVRDGGLGFGTLKETRNEIGLQPKRSSRQ